MSCDASAGEPDESGINGIEHTRTKAGHPQTSGICEHFHNTVLDEFYQAMFRRNLYHSLDELQADLDADRRV